ncbi:Wzz/FepE/Etk N-terminal domain-containing protein [Oerskovia enterophila]|uniref:Tyrosine-protein kinase wzc n=1 Tax=Oerskovia enterophila TaxID=43678 RepID=A0ABX2Y9G2_9CELL|nr:Wzz/FepE/Etk N-terminal domain-containing protein [Oerskovia enterophila]OCI32661.1 tyrosine-protein kinase wzc [Oerskovia enterophila]
MTVREFIRTVWAGKWYVLAAVLVVVAGALYYLNQQETVYKATATVQLIGVQSAQGGEQVVEVTVATDLDDVTSDPVVEAAATSLGYTGTPASLAAMVSADYPGESQKLIAINAKTLDPQESEDVANAFAEAYVAQLVILRDDQVATLDARRQALAEQLAGVTARLVANPEDPLALAEKETIVTDYTTLTVQANTLRAIGVPAEVQTPATGAEAQGPGPSTVLALAVLAGLVAGIGLAFARRGLDVRVRGAADAARLAQSPVLAELYGVRTSDREYGHSHTLPVSRKVATPFTESIRELRTAVQVSLAEADKVVVVVTAADPHAPRTFIAANLAASFALSGRRTIAVSGDLRRPELDRVLPPPDGWSGDPHTLRPTTVPNLGVFPVPEEEMDPADFLATTRAGKLIADLSDNAEVVVIDAPPVLAAADATILGRYASGVVLIASAGKTDRAVLAEASERLRINNVPLVGIALAGVKSDRRMLYASTYGDPDGDGTRRSDLPTGGQTTPSAEAPALTAERPDTGAPGEPPGPQIDEPRRAARERAAAVVTGTSSLGATAPRGAAGHEQDAPSGQDEEAAPASPASQASQTSPGESAQQTPPARPTQTPAVPAGPGQLPRRDGVEGRSAPLLAPEWGKISQSTGSQATSAPKNGAGGPDTDASPSAERPARKLPFRW